MKIIKVINITIIQVIRSIIIDSIGNIKITDRIIKYFILFKVILIITNKNLISNQSKISKSILVICKKRIN